MYADPPPARGEISPITTEFPGSEQATLAQLAIVESGESVIDGPPPTITIDTVGQPAAEAAFNETTGNEVAKPAIVDPGDPDAIPETNIAEPSKAHAVAASFTVRHQVSDSRPALAPSRPAHADDIPNSPQHNNDDREESVMADKRRPEAASSTDDQDNLTSPKESPMDKSDTGRREEQSRADGALVGRTTEKPETLTAIRRPGQLPTPYPEDPAKAEAIADEVADILEAEGLAIVAGHGIKPGPDFDRRLDTEVANLRTQLSGQERGYGITSGDYSEGQFAMPPAESDPTQEDRNYETFLRDTIDTQLAAADPQSTTPIVFLDIGGGRGVTWSRLAVDNVDAVRAGKLAFVVTNLRNPPSSYDKQLWWPNAADPAEYEQLLTDVTAGEPQDQLVHFVNSTFHGLPDVAIPLPTGQTIRLEGQVALSGAINSMSRFSQVPEIVIPEALRVMAPGGTYLVGRSHMRLPGPFEYSPRVQATQNVYDALTSHDEFIKQDIRRGPYGWSIFRRRVEG